jgi:hypothetical protein
VVSKTQLLLPSILPLRFATLGSRIVTGISINDVVFRKATQIYRSDTSNFGMGGYNLVSGRAWKFELPCDCHLRTSLNSLEFIACMIKIRVDKLCGEVSPEECLLSQTNSTLGSGWLRESNFVD